MDFTLDVQGGSLAILADGEALITDITGYLKHDGKHYNVITVPREGDWTLGEDGVASCDNMTLELSPCADGLTTPAQYGIITPRSGTAPIRKNGISIRRKGDDTHRKKR